jgi:uric acid-xanthine permease
LSALCTVTPLSVFAQVSDTRLLLLMLTDDLKNNGVIAITRCANVSAGRWCCFFLILFGILGKISGVFLASMFQIP